MTSDEKLRSHGIPSKYIVVDGRSHAFDMDSQIGDSVHLEVVKPAADWIAGFV